MIDSLLDACKYVLDEQGEPQSSYWLASQVREGKLWRASEADVRDALIKDIKKHGEASRFVRLADDEFALRSWPKRATKPPLQPSIASVEADLFVAILEFHQKVMTLLRGASLDDERLGVVADRIKALLDAASADMTEPQQANIKERLETAYSEVRRLVHQLSRRSKGSSGEG